MTLKHFITAGALALLPLTASAATLIIPAAGTGPGARGSRWQTELTFHNTGSRSIDVVLAWHNFNGAAGNAVTIAVPPRGTKSVADVVRSQFGIESGTGAIELTIADEDASRLAVTSRTTNLSGDGELGQDIPAYASDALARAGDLSVVAGPSSVAKYRFNFGLYAATATTVQWELVRRDGTVASALTVSYPAGMQRQYNTGVVTFFTTTPEDGDVVHATVISGAAIFYGSAINEQSGDPSFVPGIRARQDVAVDFVGIDLDENGTVDVFDKDRDGVLDQPIDVFTSTFPNYFRVVAGGSNTRFELVDAPRDAMLIDDNGTIEFAPGGDVKGRTGELKVRITSNGSTAVVTIPVNFR